ncbi:hypothetical protein [Micromonospora sp. NPDC005173]|uniref:hypothetical protein n=1 Tax=Micromonospora sp. NPDC005173 TaxID=3157165 RepID=UPI0033BD3E41
MSDALALHHAIGVTHHPTLTLDALRLVEHLEPPRQADQFSRRLASLDRAAAIELEMKWVP